MPAPTPRAPAAGSALSSQAVAARKREQARRATAAGPPAGFAPAEPADEPPLNEPAPDPAPATVPRAGRALSFSGGPDLGDGGGFVLGLISYALVLAYIRHGRDGVVGWIKAKLINEPSSFPAEPVPSTYSSRDVTS